MTSLYDLWRHYYHLLLTWSDEWYEIYEFKILISISPLKQIHNNGISFFFYKLLLIQDAFG